MFKKEVGVFRWNLEQRVKLRESSEEGEIVGRAEYSDREDMYYVRYQAGDGRQVSVWWGESDLEESMLELLKGDSMVNDIAEPATTEYVG